MSSTDAPRLTNIKIDVEIEPPVATDGPSHRFTAYQLPYNVLPEARIHVAATGEVFLPESKWEVGLLQNVHASVFQELYSKDGKVQFTSTTPLPDHDSHSADIWFEASGSGFVRAEAPAGGGRFPISLEFFDTPGNRKGHPGMRTHGQVTEHLESVFVAMEFRCGVAARTGSQVFQLAVTRPYGYKFRLILPSGGAPISLSDVKWQRTSGPRPGLTFVMRPPFNESQPMERSLRTTGEAANIVLNRFLDFAESTYAIGGNVDSSPIVPGE
ncbi:MAG TPA: hypothetical protein VMS17_30155 [Gemmataceae bacterium]|nr:hypothetical protein [Gemmataceae bacterium]